MRFNYFLLSLSLVSSLPMFSEALHELGTVVQQSTHLNGQGIMNEIHNVLDLPQVPHDVEMGIAAAGHDASSAEHIDLELGLTATSPSTKVGSSGLANTIGHPQSAHQDHDFGRVRDYEDIELGIVPDIETGLAARLKSNNAPHP